MEGLPLLITELGAGEGGSASQQLGVGWDVASAVTFSLSSSWLSVLEGQRWPDQAQRVDMPSLSQPVIKMGPVPCVQGHS